MRTSDGMTMALAQLLRWPYASARVVLAAVCAALVFASPSLQAQGDPNKVLRFALPNAETGFDPIRVDDEVSFFTIDNVFDTPLVYDYRARPSKLVPSVLTAMPDISADGLVYTLRFRKGIYFAPDAAFSGKKRELVAADLVYSMKRVFDARLRSPNLSYIDGKIAGIERLKQKERESGAFDYDMPIEGFQLLDRYTVRIKLLAPDYNFLYMLAYSGVSPLMAREVVEKYGDETMARPVGTGPYMLKSYLPGSQTVLVANPHYRDERWDGAPVEGEVLSAEVRQKLAGKRLPMIGRIEMQVIDEAQPRWLSFRNRQLDYIARVPPDFAQVAFPGNALAKDLQKMGVQMVRNLEMEIHFAVFTMDNPIVGGYTPDKVALRRAISLGYNIHNELAINWSGQAVQAEMAIGPGAFGHDPQFRSEANAYDPARARALLDIFGYIDRDGDGYREMPDGKPLVLEMYSRPTQGDRQLNLNWKKSMDAIGIKIAFRNAASTEIIKASRGGQLMMARFFWGGTYPDADLYYVMFYGPNAGDANMSRFKHAEFDRLYERARLLPPNEERLALYRQMNRIILAYAPIRLRVTSISTDMSHPWVIGYQRHPLLITPWKFVDIDLDIKKARLR